MPATLELPGAKLRYSVAGDGQLVILIPGARGDGTIYTALAQHLGPKFRVLIYDRRGYAGSSLDGEQDYAHRLERDADDVAGLINHEGGGKAVVFGSSSGAIVALEVLVRHPDLVSTLIAHEPPAMALLPDATEQLAFVQDIYDTYKSAGMQPAMGKFLMSMMSAGDREMLRNAAGHGDMVQMTRDFDYWFEHELRQYPAKQFDMAALRTGAGRIVFIAGADTTGLVPHKTAELFAEKLTATLKVFPGGHLGYVTASKNFAANLAGLIAT